MGLKERYLKLLEEQHEQSLREDKESGYIDTTSGCRPPAERLASLILLETIRHDADEMHFETDKKDLHVYVVKKGKKTDIIDECGSSPPHHIVPAVMERIKEICGFDLRSKKEQYVRLGDVDAFYTPTTHGERVVLR